MVREKIMSPVNKFKSQTSILINLVQDEFSIQHTPGNVQITDCLTKKKKKLILRHNKASQVVSYQCLSGSPVSSTFTHYERDTLFTQAMQRVQVFFQKTKVDRKL